ncbi:MAG: hypothetical protein OEZ39_07150 [Gammaproteobacteria bacterium]|nr:hypothetical protein [Gammaproteobacteria bacterium]MDH5651634.1 hypothetical protein [Gammaproteobacteria bacterium]
MKNVHHVVCGNDKLIRLVLAFGLFLISATIPTQANALPKGGSYHLILNGRSFHLTKPPAGKSFNESNVGSGVQYEFQTELGSPWVRFITGSAFNDSFNNLSYYGGGGQVRRFTLTNGWHIDVGYLAFVMARQDVNNYQPFPGLLPVTSIGTKNVAINLTYIPEINQQIKELVFIQLKLSTDIL